MHDHLLIFIVDDDPVFSNILGMILRQQGYQQLSFFSSAEDCIESIDESPDFIFLDYSLEQLNGLEALKWIKQKNQAPRIYMITSSEDEALKQECLSAGAELFLNKNEILDDFPARLKISMQASE